MKKFLLLLFTALVSVSGFAKSTHDIISEIGSETGAQVFHFTKDMIASQLAAMPANVQDALKDITGGSIVVLPDSDDDDINIIREKVSQLDSEYSAISTQLDDIDSVKIFGKSDGDIVTDMLLVVASDDACILVNVAGSLDKADIAALINKDMLQLFE